MALNIKGNYMVFTFADRMIYPLSTSDTRPERQLFPSEVVEPDRFAQIHCEKRAIQVMVTSMKSFQVTRTI